MRNKGRLNLRAARMAMDMSQAQAAKLAGISREKYSRIEAGTTDVSADQAQKICQVLGIKSIEQAVEVG